MKGFLITLSLLISFNAFADSPNFENNSCGEEYTFDDKTLIKVDPKKKYGYITYEDDYEFPEKMGPYNVEVFIEECNQNSAFFFNAFRVLDDQGNLKKINIYPKKSKSMNLAFDVTPAKYVTGLITEKGVCEASTEGLKKLFK